MVSRAKYLCAPQLFDLSVVIGIMSQIAKWSVVLVLVVLFGAASAGQADAHRGAAMVCGSSGSGLVVARDVQAEVYRVEKDESGFYEYWGCAYGSRRTFKLGRELVKASSSFALGLQDIVLAGTTVAYETLRSSGRGEFVKSEWHVGAVNLRTGRVLREVPTGLTFPPNPNFVGDGPVAAIVVKGDGAVAWILDTVQRENRYQVHALDATGERVLAVGSNIAPESLALAGSTLYWTQGGKPFSATLH
jgi:hypothetical protein